MTCQDSFHEVAFNISFWTRNISSARILFWRGVFMPRIIVYILKLFINAVSMKKEKINKKYLIYKTFHLNDKVSLIFMYRKSLSLKGL